MFRTLSGCLRRRRRSLMLEALLIIGGVVALSFWQSRGLPAGAAPPLEGVRTDGQAVKLGAGDTAEKAALVVFWATWCPLCKAEEGHIESVARDWPVLSVAIQSGDAAGVAKHLAARHLNTPALVDDDGRLAANWHVRGVPTHFVIDSAGNVRFRVVGYATPWGLRLRLWWAERFPA